MTTDTPAPPVLPAPTATVRPQPPYRSLLWVGLICLGFGTVSGLMASRMMSPTPAESKNETAAPESEEPKTIVEMETEQQQSAGIEVAKAEAKPWLARTWRTGRIALHDDRIAHICPAAEGLVYETPVQLGQAVAAGDVLAVIDSRELGQAKLEVYKARIALAAEKELTNRTRTAMENAGELLKLLEAETPLSEIEKRTADKPIGDYRQQLLAAYTRRRQLKAQLASQRASGGAIPESAVLKTEADTEAANASYIALVEELRFQVKNQTRQAELKLRDAETAFELARAKLVMFGFSSEMADKIDPVSEGAKASHLIVRAPFAGTIVEKHAVRSERVNPETQMFVLADLSVLWVQADAFETDLPDIRELKDREVLIRSTPAGIPERKATVTYIGEMIDKASRTLTLTAEANNSDRMLKPGLFIEVGFASGKRSSTLQIPATAVLRNANQPFVFIQSGPTTFRAVNVELGRVAGEQVEITGGIKPGDPIVVRGGFVLKSQLLNDQLVGE